MFKRTNQKQTKKPKVDKPFKTLRMFKSPAEVEERAAELRGRKLEVVVDLKNLKLNYR
ncbi:MAG: hypothetical protein V4547_16245 [Bacteroidota bacterium]